MCLPTVACSDVDVATSLTGESMGSSYLHSLDGSDRARLRAGVVVGGQLLRGIQRGTKCQSAVFMCKFILIISGTSVEGWQQPPALI